MAKNSLLSYFLVGWIFSIKSQKITDIKTDVCPKLENNNYFPQAVHGKDK